MHDDPSFNNVVYDQLTNNNLSSSNDTIYRIGFPNIGNNLYDAASSTPGPTDLDTQVASTLIRHGNFDYSTNSTVWDSTIADHTLPDAFYLCERPSWWVNTLRWPAFGPDLDPVPGIIPAQLRIQNMDLPPPGTLRIAPFE